MSPLPMHEACLAAAQRGEHSLLTQSAVMDCGSLVEVLRRFAANEEFIFLLESVTGGDKRGRYSILAFDPDIIWSCKDGAAQIIGAEALPHETPLQSLQRLIDASQFALPAGIPSMAAGMIGMLGYEMVREIEQLPALKEGPSGLPDGCLMRPRLSLIHDTVTDTLTFAAPLWATGTCTPAQAEQLLNAAQQRINSVMQRLSETASSNAPVMLGQQREYTYHANLSSAEYQAIVRQCKEAIAAGEVFQIVPGIRFSTPFEGSELAFYRALRHLNPSPYMFFLKLRESHIIGASPEILVRVQAGEITLRPIAGTRKRGATKAEDEALAADLLADKKELAEHLMLLDLGRNDVGRVAKGGSVTVTEREIIERYSHVMHIVSNVTGQLAEDKTPLQALMAGFPAGTVTGAPKIRAMQLLDELEPDRRGFYGGCVCYFSAGGDMDSCITLRTALIKDGTLHLQAGAGVVADSDPQSEYDEVCNKVRALVKAAEIAENFDA